MDPNMALSGSMDLSRGWLLTRGFSSLPSCLHFHLPSQCSSCYTSLSHSHLSPTYLHIAVLWVCYVTSGPLGVYSLPMWHGLHDPPMTT